MLSVPRLSMCFSFCIVIAAMNVGSSANAQKRNVLADFHIPFVSAEFVPNSSRFLIAATEPDRMDRFSGGIEIGGIGGQPRKKPPIPTFWLLDVDAKKILYALDGSNHEVFFSPDHVRAIVSSKQDQNSIKEPQQIWCIDTNTGEKLFSIEGYYQLHYCLFSEDGKQFAIHGYAQMLPHEGSWKRVFRFFDTKTGKELKKTNSDKTLLGNTKAWSGHKSPIIDIGEDNVAHLYDPKTFEKLSLIENVSLLMNVPDGKHFLLINPDRQSFRLWNKETGKEVYTKTGLQKDEGLRFSSDGKRMFQSSNYPLRDKGYKIFDTETGKELYASESEYVVNFTDNDMLITAEEYIEHSRPKNCKLQDGATGKILYKMDGIGRIQMWSAKDVFPVELYDSLALIKKQKNGEYEEVCRIDGVHFSSFSEDGSMFNTYSQGMGMRIYDTETFKEVFCLPDSADTRTHNWNRVDRVYQTMRDRSVCVFDIKSGKQVSAIREEVLAFSPDGKRVAVKGGEGILLVIENPAAKGN